MRVALSAKNSLSSGNYQGFGLIEILVSMLLLNIGLLGLMGLQTLGLQAERSAFFRTSASLISTDAVERIRANRTGFVASDYSSATSEANDSCFKRAAVLLRHWPKLTCMNCPLERQKNFLTVYW